MDANQFVEGFIVWLNDATFLPYGVALIALIVSLVKQLPFVRDQIWAGFLPIVFQAIFWLIVVFLKSRGVLETEIETTTGQIFTLLSAVTNFVLGITGNQLLYNFTAKKGVPILGSPQMGNARAPAMVQAQRKAVAVAEVKNVAAPTSEKSAVTTMPNGIG